MVKLKKRSKLSIKNDESHVKIKKFYEKLYSERARTETKDLPLDDYYTRRREQLVIPCLGKGTIALDLGCGTGEYSVILKGRYETVIGLDISKIALKQIPKKTALLIVGDAQHLPLKEHEFDFVLSTEVIEHLINPKAHVNEISRVLNPNGTCLITTPNKTEYRRIIYDAFISLISKIARWTTEKTRARVLLLYHKMSRHSLSQQETIAESEFVGHFPISENQLLSLSKAFALSIQQHKGGIIIPPISQPFNRFPILIQALQKFEQIILNTPLWNIFVSDIFLIIKKNG